VDMTAEAFFKTIKPNACLLSYWIRLLSRALFFSDVACQVRHGDIKPSNIVCRDLSSEDPTEKLFLNHKGDLVEFKDLTKVDQDGFTEALKYCPTLVNWEKGHICADNKRIECIDFGTPWSSSFEMFLGGEFTMMTPAQDTFSFALTVLFAILGFDILHLMKDITTPLSFTNALEDHWKLRFKIYPEAEVELYAQVFFKLLVLLHLTSSDDSDQYKGLPIMFHWIEEFYNFGLLDLWRYDPMFAEVYFDAVFKFSLTSGDAPGIQKLRESKVFKSKDHCVWFFFRFLFPVPDFREFPEAAALCLSPAPAPEAMVRKSGSRPLRSVSKTPRYKY
jgi:hypothetical protein